MILQNPWQDLFWSWAKAVVSSMEIAAPMAEFTVSQKLLSLLDSRSPPPRLRVLARLQGDDFLHGHMRPEVFRLLGPRLRVITNLHAKLYLFDRRFAVVTSSNPTVEGMEENIEVGVVIRDATQVAELARVFDSWWERARQLDVDTLTALVTQMESAKQRLLREQATSQERILREIDVLGGHMPNRD